MKLDHALIDSMPGNRVLPAIALVTFWLSSLSVSVRSVVGWGE